MEKKVENKTQKTSSKKEESSSSEESEEEQEKVQLTSNNKLDLKFLRHYTFYFGIA